MKVYVPVEGLQPCGQCGGCEFCRTTSILLSDPPIQVFVCAQCGHACRVRTAAYTIIYVPDDKEATP